METISYRSGTIRFHDVGIGPPLVLVHGSFANANSWRQISDLMSDRFRILAPDLAGYGGTTAPKPVEPIRVDRHVEVVDAIMDYAGEPIHLVGHSAGGAFALATALRHSSKIFSLTLVEPLPMHVLKLTGKDATYDAVRDMYDAYVADFEGGNQSAAKHVIDFWGGKGSFDSFPDKFKEFAAETTLFNIMDWQTYWGDEQTAEAYRAFKVPTLVIKGELGAPAAGDHCSGLYELLINSEYREIPGASHFAVATHAKQVADLIAEHVSGLR